MCVCGVWVYMCRCAHLCICAQTRNSGCSGLLLFPLILISESGFLTEPGASCPSRLYPPGIHGHAQLFMQLLRTKLGSSCLDGRHPSPPSHLSCAHSVKFLINGFMMTIFLKQPARNEAKTILSINSCYLSRLS